MQRNALNDIPPRRRELYFRIIDNEADFHPITLRLHFLNDHFPPDKLDAALRWLVSHDLVGRHFVLWFKTQCGNSDLNLHAKLLSVIENQAIARPVAGRSFKP